jgi:type 1 glutamine amidotransferase
MMGGRSEVDGIGNGLRGSGKGGRGEHEPVLFTSRYGKRRVFYTVLGQRYMEYGMRGLYRNVPAGRRMGGERKGNAEATGGFSDRN